MNTRMQNRIGQLIRYHYYRNRHLTNVYDEDDLFQETWIQFTNSENGHAVKSTAEQGDEHSSAPVSAAIRKVVDRAFGRFRKRLARGRATETRLEFDPSTCLPDAATILDLKNQIESLPDEERVVIEMLQCGFDGVEVADKLGVSPQTVSRRKHRAIDRLRRILNPQD